MAFKDPAALRAYQREWERQNREKTRARQRAKWAIYKERRNKERIKAQRKARYKLHVDKHRQRAREYGAAHKAEQKVRSRKWYEANKTMAREQSRAYVQQDPEKWREYYRQYYLKNRDHRRALAKLWTANNPDKARAIKHKSCLNRRARKRKAFIEAVDPRVVFERDKGQCGICGQDVALMSKWEIDHVIPLAKGGAHSYDNVQLAHRRCNRCKRDKLPTGQATLFQLATDPI